MRGDPFAFLDDLVGGLDDRGTGERSAAGIESADTGGDHLGVAISIADFAAIDAESVGKHLAKGGAVALTVIHRAAQQGDAAARVEADLGVLVIGHGDAGNRLRHADAEQLSALERAFSARLEISVIAGIQRAGLVGGKFAAIVAGPQTGRVRKLVGGERVDPAQPRRVHAQLPGGPVDHHLDHVARLRLRAAAVLGVGHGVGEGAGDGRVNGRGAVHPGEAAEPGDGRPEIAVRGVVGADRHPGVGAQREKPEVRVQRQLGIDESTARLLVAQQSFRAFGHPLDRPAHDLGCPERQRVFRHAAATGSEAAAHVVANDPEAALRKIEDLLGKYRANAVRRLDGGADRVTVFPGVVVGKAAARLHGVAGHPVDANPVAHDVSGPGEARLDRRLVAHLVREGLVARIVVPDRGRAGRERIVRRDQSGQGGVVDGDQLCRIPCLLDGLRDDEGDRLAGHAHAVPRQ